MITVSLPLGSCHQAEHHCGLTTAQSDFRPGRQRRCSDEVHQAGAARARLSRIQAASPERFHKPVELLLEDRKTDVPGWRLALRALDHLALQELDLKPAAIAEQLNPAQLV
jgi:hypothetical protein